MKPATAAALAACLEQMAAALREEGAEPKTQRQRLAVVAKDKGLAVSTLRDLVSRREITATRVGRSRGIYMIDPREVEASFQRKTQRARVQLREVSA